MIASSVMADPMMAIPLAIFLVMYDYLTMFLHQKLARTSVMASSVMAGPVMASPLAIFLVMYDYLTMFLHQKLEFL